MDPYFDPYISNSAKIATCSRSSQDNKCYFKQSYSEGSSWHAFKVTDKLTMGDSNYSSISRKSSNWSILFEFGCQDSESGLFRTQNIDGIMGMSASEDTLPYKLFNQNIASTKAFTLCMRNGGGYISLGANNPIYPSMQYIKLIKSNGVSTNEFIDIECPPKSYTEKLNNYNPSKYAFRIYLTENSGVVLGL
eukprot:gene17622-23199_t